MENFIPGLCGSDPCATDSCGSGTQESPLCHPDLAILPMVPSMRLIGVLGHCLVTLDCSAEGFVISTGAGITVSKSPCFDIPWERQILLDSNGEIVFGAGNLPLEGQPPSVESVLVTNGAGCMRRYRGVSSGRQKLISQDGEISFVDDPILVDDEQSFCTTTTCEVFIVPNGGPYTLTVEDGGFFVVGEGVAMGELLFEIVSKPATNTLLIRPTVNPTEAKSIPAGTMACYSVIAWRCNNTPVYDAEDDGAITMVKICTEDGGDRLLPPEQDKILAGVLNEETDAVEWRLVPKTTATTGLLFYPVTKEFKQVSTATARDVLHQNTISFDTIPVGQIPTATPGRDVYMVVNLYHEMSMSSLRNWICKVYDAGTSNNNDLVMLHRQTNTASNTMGSMESTQAIIKCHDQGNLRSLRLWHILTGATQDNPHSSILSAQLVGYMA
jgi:hypothetical protein